MLVRELMSSPVVTVDESATLRVAVGRMLEHDVGSLVVVAGGSERVVPVGILTATDVLARSYECDEPLSACSVEAATSAPLTTTAPDRTVSDAIDRMIDAGVKHLPVVDGLDVVGMLTVTDVASNYEDAREEAMALIGEGREWSGGDDD